MNEHGWVQGSLVMIRLGVPATHLRPIRPAPLFRPLYLRRQLDAALLLRHL